MNFLVKRFTAFVRWRLAVGAVVLQLLPACQTSLPTLQPNTAEGPITYMMSVRQNTSAGLDRLMTQLETAHREDTPDYRIWSDWWCPRYVRGTDPPPPDLQSLVRSYCEAHGGLYDRNKACITHTEPRTVLFYMSVFRSSGCAGSAVTARSLVIEPKPGREHSAVYLAALRVAGYVPPDVLATEQARNDASEADRLRREMPLLTKRGTRVCKERRGFIFYGFVEDVLPDQSKIKISVNGTTIGLTPGGWQPETVWDQPQLWRVCE